MNNVKIEELKRDEFAEALEVLNEAAKSYKKILRMKRIRSRARWSLPQRYKIFATPQYKRRTAK